MKLVRFKKLIVAATVFCSVFICGSISAYASSVATVNGSSVNIRQEASKDSAPIGTVKFRQSVFVVGVVDEFAKVSFGEGVVAYIATEFLKVDSVPGIINKDGVNIRLHPTTDLDILGKANLNDVVEVVGKTNEWYVIKYDAKEAYIHENFIDGELLSLVKNVANPLVNVIQEEYYGIVTAETGVNLRSQPSIDSALIGSLAYNEAMDILGTYDDFYKVAFNGQEGFVSAQYIDMRTGKNPTPSSVKAQQIISFAKQYLGKPYVWASANLETGTDCSGFTYSVMKNFGIDLNRSSREQIHNGTRVDKSDLKQGDLVFFNTGGNSQISHVGMYIGNGDFIHSASTNNVGIKISSLYESYYQRTYYGASRVIY